MKFNLLKSITKKPHISRWGSGWNCMCLLFYASGKTPLEAYANWRNQLYNAKATINQKQHNRAFCNQEQKRG